MAKFDALLRERRLNAALIVDTCNVRYLSGFTGTDSALLTAGGERFILTDFRFVDEARVTAPAWTIVTEPDGIMEKAGALARKLRVDVLAIEPGAMRLTDLPPLRKACGRITLKQEHFMVGELRLFKSALEVRQIEAALRIQERCFVETHAELRDGITERDAAEELRHRMILAGADDQAFDVLFQFGTNSGIL